MLRSLRIINTYRIICYNRPLALYRWLSVGRVVTIRFQIPICASRQIFWVARVFFRMAPSSDGERARQLANTLLGAKDGGHHHPKRTSALTSLRCQIRCCALATTIPWFYELIDRQLATETVAQAQRRLVRRKLVNTTARSWRCRPPSLAPNSVLVSRSARSPSCLGLTRRHREEKTRDPILVKSQRVSEINESTI